VQQRNARPHYQLRFGQVRRQLAEVLDREGWRQWLGDIGEADLFASFAAGRLEGGF
jgi:hypothetical protein